MNRPIFHHYVPRHLQKGFASDRKGSIFCFDKHEGKSFPTNVGSVLAENKFHEFEIDFDGEELIVSFEGWATEIEKIYLPSLNKIRELEDLNLLSEIEIARMLYMISFQHLRTNTFRKNTENLMKDVREKIGADVAPGSEAEEQLRGLSKDEQKRFHVEFLREHLAEFAEMLIGRDYVLMRSPSNTSFILGDTPVVLYNEEKFDGIRGNLGWNVAGIQIFLPVSSSMMLCVLCPSISAEFQAQANQSTRKLLVAAKNGTMNNWHRQLADTTLRLRKTIKEFQVEKIVTLTDENVIFFNSLQITYATRFIVSKDDNFDLAVKMIGDNEKYKYSMRPTIM